MNFKENYNFLPPKRRGEGASPLGGIFEKFSRIRRRSPFDDRSREINNFVKIFYDLTDLTHFYLIGNFNLGFLLLIINLLTTLLKMRKYRMKSSKTFYNL